MVGGGASGTLVAIQLLRLGGAGLEVLVLEPRAELGAGAAFGTRDPWHRLNVAASTMSALPDDPDHFRRWAGVAAEAFLPRMTWARYLRVVLADGVAGSAARLVHRRAVAARLAGTTGSTPSVVTASGERLDADAVVIATGNALPTVPPSLAAVRGDPRFLPDPWPPSALDPVVDGETVVIVGTGLTAIDLAATLLRSRPACRVVAISRRGDLPRMHEDPWRPRPPEPAFQVAEFTAASDPFAFARERIEGHPDGWRQGLDSLRPISVPLWLSMDEALRRRFVDEWRHGWEIRRSRVAAEVIADVQAWIAAGRLSVRSGAIERVVPADAGLRVEVAGADPIVAGHVLLATGPDERPAANPFLAAAMGDGWLRAGPLGMGIDVDPVTLRVLDADGASGSAAWALGPVLKGALWETTAIPEIRVQAARIAEGVLGSMAADSRRLRRA